MTIHDIGAPHFHKIDGEHAYRLASVLLWCLHYSDYETMRGAAAYILRDGLAQREAAECIDWINGRGCDAHATVEEARA